MMPQPLAFLLGVTLLLTACAATPLQPLPATHPASPQAAEAPVHRSSENLQEDVLVRTTRQLLNGNGQSQPQGMSDMPGMNQ